MSTLEAGAGAVAEPGVVDILVSLGTVAAALGRLTPTGVAGATGSGGTLLGVGGCCSCCSGRESRAAAGIRPRPLSSWACKNAFSCVSVVQEAARAARACSVCACKGMGEERCGRGCGEAATAGPKALPGAYQLLRHELDVGSGAIQPGALLRDELRQFDQHGLELSILCFSVTASLNCHADSFAERLQKGVQ